MFRQQVDSDIELFVGETYRSNSTILINGSQVEVVNDEIQIYGDVAFTRGSFKVTLTPRAGGECQILDRRYIEIWRKEQGRWLVVRAMDNLAR